ncbi:hypothetical protein pEaSNUABM28_00334 [Erwinia phage pEa_SNUABM_28]|uniref:Uncharacterized protein n=2 Tax=Alexandravirus TaxID=2733088 RepID=A0AAE9BUR2_9CAUD|nr:hypothetical protein MPK63_gp331 [Erwinia phage pEa_SNUABM_22]YP_010300093.1 hypothetical protein MPK64_gp332 [Erwinia phage pEa_SNUABM_16]QZE58891.1 hypothetical protein pEaSNUABM28_00334 [Erwinia phage pEa_SNUABM_28]QZE59232.1 hypothetical protein pEaSNUABM18_00329 [Erwinia phage pEa_SNUABM_18]UAW96476.1 hypothetical protein pEaSNUABM16_00332 [Erwinia phage pEa_SNUABM_16]UAW96819.1 hypothetical protein pEaSNUABM22_00332 [Erwinia phage pEa_SNUABM_22]
MAKAPKTSLTPTLVSRIAKKSGSIGTSKVKPSDLPHDIVMETVLPVELIGFITDRTENSVTIRHKKGHGSSAQIVSTFGPNQLLSVLGEAGSHGSVIALINAPVREYKGFNVKYKGSTLIATSVETGEVVEVNTALPGITVRATVNETAAAKKYGTPLPTKAKKLDKGDKAGKSAKAVKKVKK